MSKKMFGNPDKGQAARPAGRQAALRGGSSGRGEGGGGLYGGGEGGGRLGGVGGEDGGERGGRAVGRRAEARLRSAHRQLSAGLCGRMRWKVASVGYVARLRGRGHMFPQFKVAQTNPTPRQSDTAPPHHYATFLARGLPHPTP